MFSLAIREKYYNKQAMVLYCHLEVMCYDVNTGLTTAIMSPCGGLKN